MTGAGPTVPPVELCQPNHRDDEHGSRPTTCPFQFCRTYTKAVRTCGAVWTRAAAAGVPRLWLPRRAELPPPPRRLGDVDGTVTSPPDAGQPRPRRHDGSRPDRSAGGAAPAGEPSRGRARIESDHVPQMFLPIVQDVHNGVPHFPRRPEQACVVAVGPHRAPPAQHAVDAARQTDGEALNAAGPRARRVGLGDQMNVVALDAEVEDPERRPRGGAEMTDKCAMRAPVAQRWQPAPRAERHVNGTMRSMRHATAMRNAATTRRDGTSGACTTPAPGPNRELELMHLIEAENTLT
jgi:hypothetical protein